MATVFYVFVGENHSKLPTLYWLPRRHKIPNKSHFIANSSSFTTTELSLLLTSYLTAIKPRVIKIVKHKFRGMVKVYLNILKI